MRILAISGSLRRGSYNRRLLEAAREVAPEGVEVRVYEELKAVPPYDEDDDVGAAPAAAAHLRDEIEAADAVLFATPEYNSSVPGQLKNAVDWASRPHGGGALRSKPVAVVGASQGAFGAVWAQAELRKTLAASGARVVDGEVAVGHAHERFDAEGRLVDRDLREQLAEVMGQLAAEARARLVLAATA